MRGVTLKYLKRGYGMSRRKKTIEQQVKDGLCELAFGSISDAVSLLYLSEEEIVDKLPKLKLMNVSEIKRPKGGGMEIKFFDRIKAMEKLIDKEQATQDTGLSFYQALERSTENISRESVEDD